MENIKPVTYAYETDPDNEELVNIKKEELKRLRLKTAKDKRYRLANSAQRRVFRDDKIDKINLKLRNIKEYMIKFNRMGKIEKDKNDILKTIHNLIKNDVELAEEIERTAPKVKDTEETISVDAKIDFKDTKETISIDEEITSENVKDEVVDEAEVTPPGR